MTLKFLGKKDGMAQVYDENGKLIPCTVIVVEPNLISQIKSKEKDGYNAVQLAAFQVTPAKVKNVSKPLQGHYKKAGINPRRSQIESRTNDIEAYQLGQEIDVSYFADISHVDVSSISKGKGFQGVMKRYHFKGGPAAHGSGFHRHGGSTGMRSTPGRCLPGTKIAGRMGGKKVTNQNLPVVKVYPEKNVILVAGTVPGARGSIVTVRKAVKKNHEKKK
jgi:large subunit ribosomal protein L3